MANKAKKNKNANATVSNPVANSSQDVQGNFSFVGTRDVQKGRVNAPVPETNEESEVENQDGIDLDVNASDDDFGDSEPEDPIPMGEQSELRDEQGTAAVKEVPPLQREQIIQLKNDPAFRVMMMEMFSENFKPQEENGEVVVRQPEPPIQNRDKRGQETPKGVPNLKK